MAEPLIVKVIPSQVINEQAALGPIDLNDYIQDPDGGELQFEIGLTNGDVLPQGLIGTTDGILTGIPTKGTDGVYEVQIEAMNNDGAVTAIFLLTIQASLASETRTEKAPEVESNEKIKTKIWEALQNNQPITDLINVFELPITPLEIYYFLERFGTLKIWDAFNLDPAGPPIPLQLEGMSDQYCVFDRGSCLVAVPKELFSHERTLVDGLQTARVMAREAYSRGWTMELVGFDKLTRAAWVELQLVGAEKGKQPEIINYTATVGDVQLFQEQAVRRGLTG